MKKLATSAWCALVFLIVPFALTAQLPSYLPTNGLVAWYPFNGNANDESGNNQNTLGENATLASDRFNNPNSAYYFDGSAFFQNTSINLTSNPGITISTWFKVTDFNEAQGGHLCMFYSEPRAFQVFITNQGITFRVWNYDLVFDLSSNLFTENEWHNVIITSNFINETKIYLDGELRSQLPNGVPVPQNNSYFTIGKHSFFQPPAGAYKGYLDDIAIYARALNSAEIQQLLNSSSGPSEEGGFGGPVLPLTPSPPGMPYQAEVRNESGEVLANANVNIRFTLHEQAADGAVSYQETHALTTNDLGLFAATIGAGTAVQGTFASINWAQTTKFLKVEVDTGNGWITMGNQQLMSVPYALYAANGPVGQKGPEGPQGIQGPVGPIGPAGPTGNGCLTHYIGENFGGGMIFHVYRDSSGAEHGLIVYPEVFYDQPFGDFNPSMIDCSSDWDGLSNTECLASFQTQGIARLLSDFNGGGYNDWYLPSITEFQLLKSNIFSLRKNGFLSNQIGYSDYSTYGFWTSTMNSTDLSIRIEHFRSHESFVHFQDFGGYLNIAPAIRKF
jgi:hypothetical protein